MRQLLLLGFLLVASTSYSSPASLNYQGRITKVDGTPFEYNQVRFLFEFTNSDGSCVIYREQSQVVDMTNSGGVFDVPIGDGAYSVKFPLSGFFSLVDVFNNRAASFDCAADSSSGDVGGSWVPSVTSIRKLRVRFWDGSGWQLLSQDTEVRSVPFANYAQNAEKAEKIGTLGVSDLLTKANLPKSGSVVESCTASGKILSFDGVNFVCVEDQQGTGSGSGSGITSVTSSNSYLSVVSGSSSAAITLNVGTVANTVAAGNDSRLSDARIPTGSAGGDLSGTYPNPTVTKINGHAVDAAVPTSGQVMVWNSGKYAPVNFGVGHLLSATGAQQFANSSCSSSQTLNWSSLSDTFTCVNISGLSAAVLTSGTVAAARLPTSATAWIDGGSGNLYYSSGNVGIGTGTPGSKLEVAGQIKITGGVPGAGKVLTSDATGLATWEDPPAGGGGLSSVSSGNSYLTVTNGSSAPIVTANVGSVANTLAAGNDSRFTDARAPTGSAGGDLSGTYPNPTVTKINGNSVAATVPTAGQVMIWSAGSYTPVNFGVSHLLSVTGVPQFASASCSASQTLNWSSLTDSFTCVNIAGLNASVITAGTIAAARLPTSATAWVDGGAGLLYYNGGNVGIGTGTPGSKLEVAGQVKITGGTPGAGKVLTSDAAGLATWQTLPAGNAGTVTSVTSGNSYLTVTSGTSTPVVTANIGTAVNTLAAGNDSRFTDARTPTGTAGGDLSGTYPNPTVAKINGNAVAATVPTAGQVMIWSAGKYTPVNFGIGHLLTSTGAQQFASASCTASQTLTWSTLTDTFTCVNIAGLNASVLTAGTIAPARLPTSATAWVDGGAGLLYYNGGNVGIGTATPGTKLEVVGQVKITGGTPGAGKVLTSDAAGLATWQTPTVGTVTSVTSGNSYLSVTSGTTAPVVTANIGTAVNTLAAGNDSRFTDARTPTGTAAGDLSGTYPNPTVAKINGNAVAATVPTTGQVMIWSAGKYTPVNFGIGHLLTSTGAQQFASASCTAAQTLVWSTLTDTFSCASIAGLNTSVLTAGTIAAARLPTSATAWVDGGSKISYSGGPVGIGTTAPRSKLDVQGGSISGAPVGTDAGAGPVDFATSNIRYTSGSCGAYALYNLKDGSSYTFVVKGATAAKCTFTAFSGSGTTALTVHLPSDNANTTAGKHTIYSLIVAGSDVYVAWMPGY